MESFSIPHYTEKTERQHQTPAPNLLGRHLAYQTGECQALHNISPATTGINQHGTLGRLTPIKKKKLDKQRTEN
jgi:hypothetical protein